MTRSPNYNPAESTNELHSFVIRNLSVSGSYQVVACASSQATNQPLAVLTQPSVKICNLDDLHHPSFLQHCPRDGTAVVAMAGGCNPGYHRSRSATASSTISESWARRTAEVSCRNHVLRDRLRICAKVDESKLELSCIKVCRDVTVFSRYVR